VATNSLLSTIFTRDRIFGNPWGGCSRVQSGGMAVI
jgi:hypothetical protein